MPERIFSIVPHKTNTTDENELAKTAVFDVAGFKVTTNAESSSNTTFQQLKFSQGFTLDNLSETPTPTFSSLGNIRLNLDRKNLNNFITYGSSVERFRVAIENIILEYPAAINVKKTLNGFENINVTNATYNPFSDTTTFFINTNFFSNPFEINYLKNVEVSEVSQLRNLVKNPTAYELDVNGNLYPILEVTGSNQIRNDRVDFKVQGKPFNNGNSKIEFFIKLKQIHIDDFYKNLSEFDNYLINPNQDTLYRTIEETDGGNILEYNLKFSWPKLDKYNLDIKSQKYKNFLEDLINYAKDRDELNSNVILRMYTPMSLRELTFDSNNDIFIEYGNIPKLLLIYGRHFDEINQRIKNIRYFNTLTYDRQDNMPDNLIRSFAKTLGWDVTFPEDFDIDIWKNLLINTVWIWKAKGTRKAIDFVFKYLNIPEELIEFNEYVYLASKRVNVDKLNFYLQRIDEELTIENLAVDDNGLPKYLPQTDSNFFQMSGNTDNGISYFHQFLNLLPTFTGSTARFIETTNTLQTIFQQDFLLSSNTLDYDIVNDDLLYDACFTSTGQTVSDPLPTPILDECGCPLPVVDKALEICTSPIDLYSGCTSTPFFLDVWFNCSGGTSGDSIGTANIDVYGGTPPYTFTGLQPNDQLSNGVEFTVFATDAEGCQSDTYEGTVVCGSNPCSGVTIDFDLSFTCQTTSGGENTGNAVLNINNIVGGTPPYTTTGAQDGDIVADGQIIAVSVVDSNSCQSRFKLVTIECPVEDGIPCNEQTVELDVSVEATSVDNTNNISLATLNYDITELPEDTSISSINVVASDGFEPFLVGDPVNTNRTSASGAILYQYNFDPDPPQAVTMDYTFTITLDNGCQFITNFSLVVNAGTLGDAVLYNEIISGS